MLWADRAVNSQIHNALIWYSSHEAGIAFATMLVELYNNNIKKDRCNLGHT